MDLFTPTVAADRLHQNFVRTLDDSAAGVRDVLTGWAEGFKDRDGKFVREFQTTYNSSFWELYLFAVLKELGIGVDFSFDAPDFVCPDQAMAIEAVIASHAQDDVPEWKKTIEGIVDKHTGAAYAQSIIRLANAITNKSEAFLKRYATLPQMQGRSYVVAVSNYGTQDFNMIGDVPMQWLLYDHFDLGAVIKPNGSTIELGWFKDDRYAHISAVMYSALGTFGKARALSKDDGQYVFHAIRIRNNQQPIRIVANKTDYSERGAKAWHPNRAGSLYPASGDAGPAEAVESDVLPIQLWVPTASVGASRRGTSAAVHCARQRMGGGPRSGKNLRSSQS
jgi:hypothetical protein